MSPTGEHADLSVQNAGQTTSPPPQIPEAAHIDEGNQKSTPIETANAPPPPQKPSRRHSFAEEVVGYAKQIRGTVLHQPGTKEMGEKILKGEATYSPKEGIQDE